MLHRLPPELSQIICELLNVQEIQALRLVSRYYHELTTPFLLNEVQLVLHPDSFDRLLAVSRHPIISGNVTSLYYEPNMLGRYCSRKEWEKHVKHSDEKLYSIPHHPPPGASHEEITAYGLAMERWDQIPDHNHTPAQLDVGYVKYQALYQLQQSLKKARYGNGDLVEAMAHLPNLRDFTMTMGHIIQPVSKYLENCFEAGLTKHTMIREMAMRLGYRKSVLYTIAHSWLA